VSECTVQCSAVQHGYWQIVIGRCIVYVAHVAGYSMSGEAERILVQIKGGPFARRQPVQHAVV
jgi:hypothetical protein